MSYDEQTLLDASWRPDEMVGRRTDLKTIQQAIEWRAGDLSCRIVLVTGPGGIGKSRLLEEVQKRHTYRKPNEPKHSDGHAHDEEFNSDNVIISDVIDMMDIRLSARTQMLQALHNALSFPGGIDFEKYASAMREYLRAVEISASFQTIKLLADKAEAAFWKDYEEQAIKRRIVLLIDTAEHLVLRSSDWLIERNLLNPDEMLLSSQQWMLKQLRDGRLQNTTLVFAGRDGEVEGKPFFDELRSHLKELESAYQVFEVALKPFTDDETFAYFQSLANDWQKRAGSGRSRDSAQASLRRISDTMQSVADNKESLKVLYQMTGGRPVLLSLYGDLILEAEEIPAPLQLDLARAQHAVETVGLRSLQSEIERAFILLFFHQPGLRADIMQALARCPAGLNAAQLHFLLDSDKETETSSWVANPKRIEEITEHLEQIRRLSLARPRPYDRLGLQDEIYRIYAEQMSNTEVWTDYEREQRLMQYEKLSQWAKWQLKTLRAEMRMYQEEEQRRTTEAIRSPRDSLRPRISSPLTSEQHARSEVQSSIWNWELELLHYDLLRDPVTALNNDYHDLAERRWRASDEAMDFIVQQQMWRVLHDQFALSLTIPPDNARSAHEKGNFQASTLRRMACEEDPARWIKRFILRREYQRAIELYESVEKAIRLESEVDRRTWLHPLNVGERRIWQCYAQIMIGQDVELILQELERTLRLLTRLTSKTTNQLVMPEGVTGFKGHPALARIYRIVATGYNFAGYGYTAPLGKYKKGVELYGLSVYYSRLTTTLTQKISSSGSMPIEEPLGAQQAATRNNLARALASLGREEHGQRVCLDALSMRRILGAEIPIAYSLNTLSLINNSLRSAPTGWREAAQAAAIFRRAGENRGLGLALIQLGIGLRHLANSRDPLATMDTSKEELYNLAVDAIGEAVDIFQKDPERLRSVEATLEYGCVLRDLMFFLGSRELDHDAFRPIIGSHVSGTQKRIHLLRRDAEYNLKQAFEQADKHGFRYLALQAHVDLAWTHFYAGDFESSEATAKEAELRVPANYLISAQRFPDPDADESHYFYQLAKIQGLYAGVAMARFKERRAILRQVSASAPQLYEQVRIDKDANAHLVKAAEYYVLALYYGQMFSPRSRSLVITFDHIYEHVKGFNTVEYEMFYRSQHVATAKYRDSDKPWSESSLATYPFDFSKLEDWLKDCFGPLDGTQEGDQLEASNELS